MELATTSKLNDVSVWEADFPDMAQPLVAEGSLFPNCIGFFDGHFQRICRPLGTVALHQLIPAERFYNGYEKAFGLKYIVWCWPMALCLHGVNGPETIMMRLS